MAGNSYLQPWFYASNFIANHLDSGDADFSHLGARIGQLRPCSIRGVQVDFSRVCQNAALLFEPSHPANLLNCGLWATLFTPRLGNYTNTPTLRAIFDSVGLSSEDWIPANMSNLQNTIANCAADFYSETHSFTDNDQWTPYSCSSNSLFYYSSVVEFCFAELCGPRTLNPDIGGIGVRMGLSLLPAST